MASIQLSSTPTQAKPVIVWQSRKLLLSRRQGCFDILGSTTFPYPLPLSMTVQELGRIIPMDGR